LVVLTYGRDQYPAFIERLQYLNNTGFQPYSFAAVLDQDAIPEGVVHIPYHTLAENVFDAVWFDGLSAGTPFSIGAYAASTTKSIAPKKSVQPSAISFGASSTPNFAEASMERAMSVMPILWRLKPGCIGINAWKEIGELLLRIVRVMETLPSLGL
jgi:hypothetical protein